MAKPDTTVTTIDDAPKSVDTKKVQDIDHKADDAISGDKAEVTIHAGEGELGRQAVFLAINGHGFNIPRGVACRVPVEVIEVLENATMVVYEPTAAGQNIEREVKRFSYTVKYPKA